ncbi:MAG TPA: porin [Gammaproteobacteria bacterium]
MNKKLLAIAVAAGLAMPMAAMAEMSAYGVGHVSLDVIDDGTDSAMNIASNSSRFGLKGSMDLDNGMKAGLQIETGIALDNRAGGTLADRNSFVSLGGGFGEVRIGNHDTPFKDVRSTHDLFNDYIGDLRNFSRSNGTTNAWDERARNSILYISPMLGDVATIKFQYSTNTGSGTASGSTANDNDAYSANVIFNAGPVRVTLAYEMHNINADDDESAMRAGVQYKGGPLTINGFFHSASDQGGVSGADLDVMGLGVGFKTGATLLKLQYAMADDFGDATDTGATILAVGADFAMSKSSTIYIAYAMTENDDNADYSVTGGGGHGDDIAPSAVGEDPSGFSLGYIVKF